jgi:hypothetical protein
VISNGYESRVVVLIWVLTMMILGTVNSQFIALLCQRLR